VRDGIALGARQSPVATLVSSTLPELLDDAAAWELARAGVPTAAGLRTGLRCAAALLGGVGGGDPERLRAISEAALAAAGGTARAAVSGAAEAWLPEHLAKARLRDAGVAVPAGRIVVSADDAVAAWRELGGPVALKLSAAGVVHKSELGAVALGLDDERAVRDAQRRLEALAVNHGGVVVAERMVPAGLELIVAAHTDGVVPALVVGLGGIWTELLHDVAVIPLPASPERIADALRGLRGAPLLTGGRGRPRVDVDAAARLAARVGETLLADGLATVECNPVIAGLHGAVAVDAAIRVGDAADG
jgi:acetyl-CoA synthetase